jgi:hypothetical protein
MTLVNPGYFQEIIGSLRDDGFEVRHFALLAEHATVVRRLRGRSLGLEPRRQRWETGHAIRRRPGAGVAAPVRDHGAQHPLELAPSAG